MRITRPMFSTIVCALLLATLALALVAPAAPVINVRWSQDATTADRIRAEDALHLGSPEPGGERTWRYRLLDGSTANVTRIVAHPLVEDTHNIDRDRLTVAPESPPVRGSIRQWYGRWPLRMVYHAWPWVAGVLAAIALAAAWPALRAWHQRRPARTALAGILLVSLVLRLVLVFSGGQFYWPDEGRYRDVRSAVAAVAANDPGGAAKVLDEPAHVLFKLVAALPAALEFVRGEDSRIPATFFALFSVVNIGLLVVAAERLQAGAIGALLAGIFFAITSSSFYYSRHLLPYDLAMAFGLLAVVAGCAREATWRSSAACGVWAGCAFLAYAGYWTLGGAACLIHVCDGGSPREAVRRAVAAATGLAAALGGAFLLFASAGKSPLEKLAGFAGQVTQGSYEEGWRLPLEYLWHAEHLLLVGWLVCLAWCVPNWRLALRNRTVRAGVVGVVFIYGSLWACSVLLNLFVVYGRLARQVVPFFCLIAAGVLAGLWQARPVVQRTAFAAVVAVALVAQAATSFLQPLRQRFPREFIREADAETARIGAPDPTIVYAHHIYPTPEPFTMTAGSVALVTASHPLQFLPYQYEGFTPGERRQLRATDIRMRALIPAGGSDARSNGGSTP